MSVSYLAEAETRDDVERDPQSSAYWQAEIEAALVREKTWRERAEKIVKRYRDERPENSDQSRLNILWANTEVMKSSVYAQPAKPDVRRRFSDAKAQKDIARTAAEVQERALTYCSDEYDFDSEMQRAVEEMLLPGRGTVWAVYDADVDGDSIGEQQARMEHVYWMDFIHGQARCWRQVPWVARRHLMTRDELVAEFGEDGSKLPLNHKVEGCDEKNGESDSFKRAEVWEVWDKSKKERLYVVLEHANILKVTPDPYKLKHFFPCPKPLYSVTTTSSLIPVPEFTLYQDLANELDIIQTRIRKLTEALKRRGVYDATADDQHSLANLPMANDNVFLPWKGAPDALAGGGLANVFMAEDLRPAIAVLQGLYQQRALLVQSIYEVTGISDIVRGSTDPNETKGAQQLKAQFGSMRMQSRQKGVQSFIRQCFEIKAEIVAEHFTIENLEAITQMGLPRQQEIEQQIQQLVSQAEQKATQVFAQLQGQPVPDEARQQIMQAAQQVQGQIDKLQAQVTWEKVMEILQSDQRRGYSIDIETDSTVFTDAQEEKQSAIEFVEAFFGGLQKAGGIIQAAPQMMAPAKEVILMALRKFKAGRAVEQVIEDAFENLAQNPPQPPQQGNAEADKAKFAMEQQKMQVDVEHKKALLGMEQQKMQMELQFKERELGLKEQEIQVKSEMDRERMETEQMRFETDDKFRKSQAEVPYVSMGEDQVSLAEGLTAFGSMLQQLAQGIEALQQQNQAVLEGQQTLQQTMMLPVQAIRDSAGRVQGAQRVVN